MKSIPLVIVSSILAFTGGYATALLDKSNSSQIVKSEKVSQVQAVNIPLETSRIASNATLQSNDDLSAAQNKILYLKEINQSLSRQIEKMNLPLPVATTFPELLSKIDKLPSSFINNLLANFFDEDYLSTIEDLHEFSKEVVEIALDSEKDEQSNGSALITFSHSPIVEFRLISEALEIDQFDTVYAHILPTQNFKNCIIKWQHIDTGEIHLFQQLTLSANDQSQYVWIRPANGWRTGHYRVNIHDMENNKQLVGANTFHVTSIRKSKEGGIAATPDLDVVEDYILSGQAVPKSY